MPTVNKEVKETVTVSKEELIEICGKSIAEMLEVNPFYVLIDDELTTLSAIIVKRLFKEEK